MKRIAVFFILLATFFIGNKASASIAPFPSASVSSNTLYVYSAPALGTENFCVMYFNGIYPDVTAMSSPDHGGCSTPYTYGALYSVSDLMAHGWSLTFVQYPYGSWNMANKTLWVGFIPEGSTALTSSQYNKDNIVYYAQLESNADGVFSLSDLASIAGKVQTQTSPLEGSSTSTAVTFTGTYFNNSMFTNICVYVSGTGAYTTHFCHELGLVVGLGIPFTFTDELPNNKDYTYTLKLFDDFDGVYTDATSPIHFKTGSGSGFSGTIPT